MLDAKRYDEKIRSSEESLSKAVRSVPRWLQIVVIGAAILLAAVQLIKP